MTASQAPSSLKAIIAMNLREARRSADLTQAQLAARMGIEPMQVSRWERAAHLPTDESLAMLAAALGREIGWFFTDHSKKAAAA